MNSDARSLALKRLSVREYSAVELRRYLCHKGFSRDDAEEVIADLLEKNWVDDRRYSRVIARHLSASDKGPLQILARLKQKGVAIDLRQTREILSEVSDIDEVTRIKKILDRRYPNAGESKETARKAFAALLRRGFSAEAIRRCLNADESW